MVSYTLNMPHRTAYMGGGARKFNTTRFGGGLDYRNVGKFLDELLHFFQLAGHQNEFTTLVSSAGYKGEGLTGAIFPGVITVGCKISHIRVLVHGIRIWFKNGYRFWYQSNLVTSGNGLTRNLSSKGPKAIILFYSN